MVDRKRRLIAILSSFSIALLSIAFRQLAPASAASATGPAGPNSTSYNGLALTPPMGFNDWYQYRCSISESTLLANAHALVTSGLAKLGYDYVNLDDCWMAPTRAADGQLQADPTRFPHGIAWLADQVHAMGLKLGVYEAIGATTCQRLPGSLGHYQQDADTFAAWGVDFLKFDYCGVASGTDPSADYEEMSQDLLATGRPIVFSGEATIAAHNADPADPRYLPLVSRSSKISNMWRVASDFTTNFASTIFGHFEEDLPLAGYAHPGGWNDLDMLVTGNTSPSYNFNWTAAQQQTQMSIWAELASPLLVSADLTNMSDAALQILSNKDVIAVDQDPLGKQGQLIAQQGPVYVVGKPLANGDVALLLVNTAHVAQPATTTARAAGLPRAGAYAVTDLWTHATRESGGTIAASVPPQSALLYRVAPLHDEVDQYPPVTSVSAAPDLPVSSIGSLEFHAARPGQTITVPASFANVGRTAVTDVSLSLTGPAGWAVTGAPVTAHALPGGGRLSGTWQVTVPPGTAGAFTLTATARYRWSDGTRSATVQGGDGLPLLLGAIPHSGMTATADSYQAHYNTQCCDPGFAIDDNPATTWHSQFSPAQPLPHEITLDLGGTYDVAALLYSPRLDNANGTITSYQVSVSTDGNAFTAATSGSWPDDGAVKTARFQPLPAHYIRLTALAGHNGFASAAEINILGTPIS